MQSGDQRLMGGDMEDLKGRIVLITGAGRGSGRALARLFAAHGAQVAANDISPVNLDDLVLDSGGAIRAYPEDIAKKVGVQAVIKQVEDDFGRIDILVNHAAVEPRATLLEIDEWDWHRVLDVNLTGAFLATQSVGRIMRQNGAGTIFNLIGLGTPIHAHSAAYAAAMYGLIALTRCAASELGPYHVFVHAVGKGLAQFHEAESTVPHDLSGAILHLYGSTRNGQIVNVEG
ncbi:MAG TPA: SDR family oxidoreductase [Anaerolineales bacterium]